MSINVEVNGVLFTAVLEDNKAAIALAEMLEKNPLTIRMSDYGGFEKVGSLGRSLPAENAQIRTKPGDIVLYQGDQIVIFYGTNSWSYTMLGHIEALEGWDDALGKADVTMTLSVAS